MQSEIKPLYQRGFISLEKLQYQINWFRYDMESDCRNMTIPMIYVYIALSDKIYVFQYAPIYIDIYIFLDMFYVFQYIPI